MLENDFDFDIIEIPSYSGDFFLCPEFEAEKDEIMRMFDEVENELCVQEGLEILRNRSPKRE